MMAAQSSKQTNSLRQLLNGIVAIGSDEERTVTALRLDSREMLAGDVFVALQGGSEHGVQYIDDVLNKQASAVLVETIGDVTADAVVPELLVAKAKRLRIPLIAVPKLGQYLCELARRCYGDAGSRLTMVGITGTNGKTSCAHYIAQGLATVAPTAIIGTLGNGFAGQLADTQHTTPNLLTLHSLLQEFERAGAKHVVMEVSSHGIDQGRVQGVKFNIALFTNLTQDHLDYHLDMQEYGNVKQRLFENEDLDVAVINVDDDFGRQLATHSGLRAEVIGYSCKQRPQTPRYLYAKRIVFQQHGLDLEVDGSWGSFSVNSHLLGEFNASNVLGVMAVLLQQGMTVTAVQAVVANLKSVAGRMQVVPARPGAPLVVVDYAHTPDALDNALRALIAHLRGTPKPESSPPENTARGTGLNKPGRLVCVFGCGGDRDASKRPLMGRIAENWADQVILTDDNPRTEDAVAIVEAIRAGLSSPVTIIHDRQQAIREAINSSGAADIILIAGKGHENYQIIGKEKRPYPTDTAIATTVLQQRFPITGVVRDSGDGR